MLMLTSFLWNIFRKRSRSGDRSKSKSPGRYGEGAIRVKDEPLDKVGLLCLLKSVLGLSVYDRLR